MASGALLGPSAWSAIATYRLPSLLGGVLAVLAVWWLLRPLLGARGSLIAAALFAVTPIVALQAQLSIPEGPLLLAIVVAQLTLLRLYCAREGEEDTRLALLFWAAQGFGILLNALAVPILSLATVVALYVFDRDLGWLKRTRPAVGVPLMLAIAAPWLLVRAHFDGVPFSSLTVSETLRALGGAQDMKWKAAPLTFTLGFILGFLPGALLLVPALRDLWTNRAAALQRFLLAWIIGYLAYLELISSKPALYTVQAMFPAAAAAVALTLERNGRLELPKLMLRLPASAVLVGMMALFAGGLTYAGVPPSVPIVLGAALVVGLLTLAARAATENLAALWLASSVAGFALLLAYTFGVALPHVEQIWPARRIAEAIEPLRRCASGPVSLLGFREPSSVFLLGRDSDGDVGAIAKRMAAREPGIAVVEDRWAPELAQALSPAQRQAARARRLRHGAQYDARLPALVLDLFDGSAAGWPRLPRRAALCLHGTAAAPRRGRRRLPLPLEFAPIYAPQTLWCAGADWLCRSNAGRRRKGTPPWTPPPSIPRTRPSSRSRSGSTPSRSRSASSRAASWCFSPSRCSAPARCATRCRRRSASRAPSTTIRSRSSACTRCLRTTRT